MEKIRNLNADCAKTVQYDFYSTRFSESVQKVVPLVQKLSFSVTGEKSSRGHFGKKNESSQTRYPKYKDLREAQELDHGEAVGPALRTGPHTRNQNVLHGHCASVKNGM